MPQMAINSQKALKCIIRALLIGSYTKLPLNKEEIFIMSENIKIVLDPGHKRDRRGGVLFAEGENNYRYSLILKKELEKYDGVTIYNTRKNMDDDPSLYSRGTMYGKADLFISIHTNAADSGVRGVEIINSHNSKNDTLAQRHVKLISETLGTPNRGVKYYKLVNGQGTWHTSNTGGRDYFGVLRDNSSTIKYLIEYVFHTNRVDSQAFLNNDKKLAEKEAKLIADYFGLKKKNSKPETKYIFKPNVGVPKEKWEKFYLYSRPHKGSKVPGTLFTTREFNIVEEVVGGKYLWGKTYDTGKERWICLAEYEGQGRMERK